MENYPGWADGQRPGDWQRISESDSGDERKEVDLADLEMDLTANR
jgi:hypothetical protein